MTRQTDAAPRISGTSHRRARAAVIEAMNTATSIGRATGPYNLGLMKLTLAQVRHVAELARLGLRDDELEALASELSTILEYIDQLEQLDTSAIAPTAQVGELFDVMREDEVRPSLDLEEALANAPSREGNYFRVRAMQE